MRKVLVGMVLFLVLANTSLLMAKTYKVASLAWTGQSYLQVAESKGFWEENNIDVKVLLYEPAEVDRALLNKRVDFAYHMLAITAEHALNNTPTIILYESSWSHGGDQLIIKKNVNLNRLKKKVLGSYMNAIPSNYFIYKALSVEGEQFKKFKIAVIEDTKSLSNNFISNRLSIIHTFEPEASRARLEGNGKILATTADFPGCMPEGIITLKENLNSIPEQDIVAFIKGCIKAQKWLNDPKNSKEYIQIIKKRTFGNQLSEADIKDMLTISKVHNTVELVNRNKTDGGTTKFIKSLLLFVKKEIKKRNQLSVKSLFNTTYFQKAINSK